MGNDMLFHHMMNVALSCCICLVVALLAVDANYWHLVT